MIFSTYRHYFALATTPGEQFYYFTNLAVWLLNQCHGGGKLDQPQEVSTRARLDECPTPTILFLLLLLLLFLLFLFCYIPQYDDPNATIATIIAEAKKLVSVEMCC